MATAGIASAQGIELEGTAQMGIFGGENVDTQFVQDIDITFSMSGMTDNGLTFGAAIDLDEDAGEVDTDDGGVAIFVSGAFGTLTMGDTDGALDWAVFDVNDIGPGSINDDETEHVGFNDNNQFDNNAEAVTATLLDGSSSDVIFAAGLDTGANLLSEGDAILFGDAFGSDGGADALFDFLEAEDVAGGALVLNQSFALDGYDGQIVRYDYGFGDFGIAASVQLDDDGRLDPMWGLGATYALGFAGGTATFGGGIQNGEIELVETVSLAGDVFITADPDVAAGIEAAFNNAFGTDVYTDTTVLDFEGFGLSAVLELDSGLSGAVSYTSHEAGNTDIDHVGVGVAYTFDAISIGANWGQYDIEGFGHVTGWGLAASYDLGGGLSTHFGYGDGEVAGEAQDSTYSFGLNMAF